jgi:type III secretory pathway component EscU
MNRELCKSLFFFVLLSSVMTYPVVKNWDNLFSLPYYDAAVAGIGVIGFYSILRDTIKELNSYRIRIVRKEV